MKTKEPQTFQSEFTVSNDQTPPSPINHPKSSKLETIKNLIKKHQKKLIIGLILVILLTSTATAFILTNPTIKSALLNKPNPSPSASPSPLASPSPSPSHSPASSLPTIIQNSPSPQTTNQPSPSPSLTTTQSSPSPLPSPSPSPTPRTPNPPMINITYPTENQSVTLSSGQTFCLVDTPAGGDTSNLQRKHKINSQSWTSYANLTTLCYEPQEGSNTISLQYKNSYGDESSIYTRNFTFHRLE